MIGALLSNTPVSVLRGSGVAGEVEPGSQVAPVSRDPAAVRDSLASPRALPLNSSNGTPLTAQAVLALQGTEKSATTRGQGGTPSLEGSVRPLAEGAQALEGEAGAAGGNEEDKDGDGLNEAEEKQVQQLAQRDREVRAHEQAHARVGGAYASAPTYTYQQGPDGKRYAVGGEVQIDTAKERTPEATIRKMQIVIRAATAPAEPSQQDLKVAQQARSQLSEAQAELRQQKADELRGGDEEDASPIREPQSTSGNSDNQSTGQNQEDAGSGENLDQGAPGSGSQSTDNEKAIAAYQSAVDRTDEAVTSLFSTVIG